MDGWIKSYRKMLDNPVVCKDSDHYAVWGYLLHNATHQPIDMIFEGERITLKPGQLITSRRSIALKFSISDSKVQRILKTFEIEHQIEQQTKSHNRLISLLNWEEYQSCEQLNEPQVNHNRTTSEPQVNTNKNIKNIENEKNDNKREPIVGKNPDHESEVAEIISYLNQKTGKHYTTKTKETVKNIYGRLNEGHTVDEFKRVIDVKCKDWLKDQKMNTFLRPTTLFSPSHFEAYLNQPYTEDDGGFVLKV